MRASWIRVSAIMPLHEKVVALPSDAARFGWIATLCAGKFCEKPGTWASEAQFREALGRRSKWLPDFLRVQLLETTEGGAVRVKNWDRWQTDPGVTERVRKHRETVG